MAEGSLSSEMIKKEVEDDQEEGEIVDSDVFEEISDNSLPPTGKCDTPKHHLAVISSSSLSDVDLGGKEKGHWRKRGHKKRFKFKKKFHRHHHHHGHDHHRRRHRRWCNSSSSSSSDQAEEFRHHHRRGRCHKKRDSDLFVSSSSEEYMMFDKTLLKAAVQVNSSDMQKNSLRSKLRAMALLDDKDRDESERKMDNDKDEDFELIELRLAALQTAIMNKKKFRKKRKLKELQENSESKAVVGAREICESEKSGKNNEIVQVEKKPCFEEKVIKEEKNVTEPCPPPEEDEDVLRALLLASMSKKITKNKQNNAQINQKPLPPPIKSNVFINKTSNVQLKPKPLELKATKPPVVRPLIHTKVKPIIIKINGDDSDSDDNKPSSNPVKEESIESTVEKFLKEQRAKIEKQANMAKKETKNSVVVKTEILDKSKKTEVFEKSKKPEVVEKLKKPDVVEKSKKSEIFEKSCVKLLPKVKQIEYRNLLQKLKNAQKKKTTPRLKRNSTKVQNVHNNGESSKVGGHVVNNSKKLVRNKPVATGQTVAMKQNVSMKMNKTVESSKNSNTNISNNSGGNDASIEIPDLVKDAKDLQKVIREMQTKNGRLQMQAKYTVLTPIVKKINEASIERKKYDKDVKRLYEELAEAKKKLRDSHLCFQMYVRELIAKKEDIDKKGVAEKVLPVTSTPIKGKSSMETFETSVVSTKTDNKENLLLNNDKHENVPVPTPANVPINFGDPNDIDKIYTVPKYISPLDVVKSTNNVDDPFTVLCPYDIDGRCKDSTCSYKHFRG